jgi:dihydrolipoamide dehydrogenase
MESGIKGLFEKYGIEVVEGLASFTDASTVRVSGQSDVNQINFKKAIIATGSSPIELPTIPFNGTTIISSKEALMLPDVPKKLIIIGGGYIGTELATVYGKLGSEVHILEGSDRLISVLDEDIVKVTANTITDYGVQIHYNAKASQVEDKDGQVTVHMNKDGQDEHITADKVMVVVGRKPNSKQLGLEDIGVTITDKGFIQVNEYMQSSIETIFAVGDVAGQPMLAHKAMREAKVAAEVASGKKSAYDNQVVPSVVFNDPELISVGLTLAQAQEKGYDVYEKRFPYAALARSHFTGRTKGFLKMVATTKDNVLLGVHGVGPHVSEILSEATLAIEMGATVEDVALTIHPHPTISESMGEVADLMMDSSVHIYEKPKKK